MMFWFFWLTTVGVFLLLAHSIKKDEREAQKRLSTLPVELQANYHATMQAVRARMRKSGY